MAVLYALLQHDPAARGKAELQPIIARHDDVLRERNVLPLAYHLLGARSLEQALFDGYLAQIGRRHPAAPLPALHQSDGILADADRYRCGPGRRPVLHRTERRARRRGGRPVVPVAGQRHLDPGRATRRRGLRRRAHSSGNCWSRRWPSGSSPRTPGRPTTSTWTRAWQRWPAHAKDLGYDAVDAVPRRGRAVAGVLRAGQGVLRSGGAEADQAGRERHRLPARSRWSRSWRGRWTCGGGSPTRAPAEPSRTALDQAFTHQQGRFSRIALGDDNLPYVANRRLLAP